MAWAAKLWEKISQLALTKQYISPLFLCISTIISRFHKRFVEIIKGISSARGLRSGKYMSALVALFYLRWRKVGTEFSQKTAASDSDDDSSCSAIIQISVSTFTFTGFFLPHQFSLDHPSSWHHLWDFKSRTREQPGLERPRAVWGLNHVLQTKSPSLILIRSTHVVVTVIYLAERDKPNLRWRLTRWKTVLKHEVGLLTTKNFAWHCIRSRPA